MVDAKTAEELRSKYDDLADSFRELLSLSEGYTMIMPDRSGINTAAITRAASRFDSFTTALNATVAAASATALIRSLTASKDKAERERDELLVWKKRRQAEDEDAADCEDIW